MVSRVNEVKIDNSLLPAVLATHPGTAAWLDGWSHSNWASASLVSALSMASLLTVLASGAHNGLMCVRDHH